MSGPRVDAEPNAWPNAGPTAETVHATLVSRGMAGVLLRGASGAGKSDLALRLISTALDAGQTEAARKSRWRLVSDDQVSLRRVPGRAGDALIGRAPPAIAGKLEIRGVGIVTVPASRQAAIRLVVDLRARADVPRMPAEQPTVQLLGLSLPCYVLHAFDASTPLKIAMLLEGLAKI